MENTRHERAIIVAASYVIGFISAFIAFGVSTLPPGESPIVVVSNVQPIQTESNAKEATLRVDSTGLVVVTEGKERLLSARKNSPLLASVIASGPQVGFAEKLADAELSRDNKFVYFCELLEADGTVCDAYVYDIETDLLYPVNLAGENFTPQIATHQSMWLADGRLSINAHVSVASETPWLLQ